MSRTFRSIFFLTALLCCHMIASGTSTALAQKPGSPVLERVGSQSPGVSLPPSDDTQPPSDVTLPPSGDTWSAQKVTKDSITWSFNKNYTVGQFITGDYYVVAPSGMSVTNIKSSSGTLGGSMKNPAPNKKQGYVKGTAAVYDAALNVGSSLPLSLVAGDMLISTTRYAYHGVVSPTNEKNYTGVEQAAILTVLSKVPPSGSFRPGICDLDRVIYNASAIKYSLLKNLTPVGSVPSLAKIKKSVSRPWVDHYRGQGGRAIHPNYNMSDYGAEIAVDVSFAALMVNSNFTINEKKPIVIGLIQVGLDTYSNVKRIRKFYDHIPAHINGRKFPVMFAGNMLNISEIKAIWPKTGAYLHKTWGSYPGDATVFAEDSMHAYVKSQDVTATAGGKAYYQPDHDYTSAMIGMPEFFHHTYTFRSKDSSSWSIDPYRFASSDAVAGVALAVYAMGWKNQWNNPAFFDYLDRYVAIAKGQSDGYTVHGEKTGSRGIYGSGWARSMWNTYRKNY